MNYPPLTTKGGNSFHSFKSFFLFFLGMKLLISF